MALSTFDGVSFPVAVPWIPGTQYSVSLSVAVASSAAACGQGSGNTTGGIGLVGDRYFVLLNIGSATAQGTSVILSSSGVASTPIPGVGAFTLLSRVTFGAQTLELWVSNAITQYIDSSVPKIPWATFNTASGFNVVGTAGQVRNSTGWGVPVTSGSASAGTAFSVAGGAGTHQNSAELIAVYSPIGTVPNPTSTVAIPSTVAANKFTAPPIALTVAPVDGVGITPSYAGNFASSMATWAGVAVEILGPTIQMDDLTYLLREDGILLNNPSNGLPVYDVSSVTGLEDDTITSNINSLDGAHGSYVDAKFMTGKSIGISGTIFATSPFSETILDNLKYSCRPAPTSDGVPFFFKVPSQVPRIMTVKPTGIQIPVDRSRTLAQVPFALTMATADARAYGPKKTGIAPNQAASTVTVTPTGNIETYPRIYFNVYGFEINSAIGGHIFTFTSGLWGQVYGGGQVVIDASTTGGLTAGAYCLDLRTRTLWLLSLNGSSDTDVSKFLTTRQWFGLIPNQPNTIAIGRPTGATTADAGFEITYQDAWL